MKSKYIFLILSFIILLGFLLRIYQLGTIPTGFHRDEAYFGYNAYSLLKTGKDMTGNSLPLHIASFLYTPAGYSYFAAVAIFFFGLSEFSVRFPSSIFGTATILITYFLAKEIYGFLEKNKERKKQLFGLLTALLLSVSPWHINLSRTASAIAVVAFFIALGVLLFIKSLRSQNLILYISSFFCFFVSLFFYIAPYSFLPLFIPLLIFFFWKDLYRPLKIWGIGLYVLLIFVPLLITATSPTLSLRIQSLSVFNNEGLHLITDEQIRGDGVSHREIFLTRIFHNRYQEDFVQISQNYFKQLSYDFFFTDQGLPDRYRVPLVGLLYLWELPFFVAGFVLICVKRNKMGYLLLGWVLLSPLGSALTTDDVPNLQRTMLMLPGLTLVVSYGLFRFVESLHGKTKITAVIAIAFLFAYGVVFYLHQYYVHATAYRPWYRQDGYQQLVAVVNQLGKNYKKIVITNRESAPTIFFLFYNAYNPSLFQKEITHAQTHDFDRIAFGEYEFSQEECPVRLEKNAQGDAVLIGKKGILYVDSGLCDIPPQAHILKKIQRHDNSTVFIVVTVENSL